MLLISIGLHNACGRTADNGKSRMRRGRPNRLAQWSLGAIGPCVRRIMVPSLRKGQSQHERRASRCARASNVIVGGAAKPPAGDASIRRRARAGTGWAQPLAAARRPALRGARIECRVTSTHARIASSRPPTARKAALRGNGGLQTTPWTRSSKQPWYRGRMQPPRLHDHREYCTGPMGVPTQLV